MTPETAAVAEASPQPTSPPTKKKRTTLFLIVCLYQGDISTVYVSKTVERALKVRDQLRAKYGDKAEFHTVHTAQPPRRWLTWQAEMEGVPAEAEAQP